MSASVGGGTLALKDVTSTFTLDPSGKQQVLTGTQTFTMGDIASATIAVVMENGDTYSVTMGPMETFKVTTIAKKTVAGKIAASASQGWKKFKSGAKSIGKRLAEELG
jgi:hypothetical protein